MSDAQDFEAELGATPASTPAATSQQTPASTPGDTTDWKAKYDGLKGYAKQLRQDKIAVEEKANQTIAGLNEQVDLLSTQLTTTLETAKRVPTLEAELNPLKQKVTVLDTILGDKKYRPLIDAYGEGVLRPDGLEGEALTGFLDKAVTAFQSVGTQNRQNFNSGQTPASPQQQQSPAESTPTTIQELNAAMRDVARTKGQASPEYAALKGQWMELVKQGKHK